jgi:hypothetical protein
MVLAGKLRNHERTTSHQPARGGSFIRLGIHGIDRHTDTGLELYLSIRENICKERAVYNVKIKS